MWKKLSAFLRKWMLPLAMTTGVAVYLLLHFVPSFHEDGYLRFARTWQPVLIGLMLFLQLNVVAPSDLHFRRWHFRLLAAQALLFAVFAFLTARAGTPESRILLESAMLCFICPTAAAAGVITSKIGGDLPAVLTYTVLSDTLAALLIPLMVPYIHPSEELGFLPAFWGVIREVFSILVLPTLLAWFIRYAFPPLQKKLAKLVDGAFYAWSVGLIFALSLATAALVESGIGWGLTVLIGLVSLACCLFQFWFGRRMARSDGRGDSLSAGQSLGQKNTGFIIWLGLSYLTPVTSVAGGLYAIWHNLVNSFELYQSAQEQQQG